MAQMKLIRGRTDSQNLARHNGESAPSGARTDLSISSLGETLLLNSTMEMFTTSLRETLQDKEKYKVLLNLTRDDAQRTLDCLQFALNTHLHHDADRVAASKALIRLAMRSGLYPDCFKITGLQILSKETVGEGSYGTVCKAQLGNQTVCVKTLRTDQNDSHQRLLKALFREGLIWARSSRHPNITPFLGIRVGGIHKKDIGLVSEWMPDGNVAEYLKHNPLAPRMDLIYDIASGLQHLHSLSIVHGDIKGRNILINPAGHACLADFGLANVFSENVLNWSSLSSESNLSGGTLRWRAPELINEEAHSGRNPPNTPASDIYSFVCTIYEILTDQVPFYEIKNSYQLILYKATQPDLKPSRPSPENARAELTDEVWELMEDGWFPDPKQRPRMREMLKQLGNIVDFS